jgi:flagellar biosynthesis anti-sigma factor FlgM
MIENNPISSYSTKPAEQLQSAEMKAHTTSSQSVEKDHDKVELSNEAKLLSKASSALDNSSEVRNEKVEEITKQVQDGIYQVPVNKLADAILERLYSNK